MNPEDFKHLTDKMDAVQSDYQGNMQACTRMLSMSVILAALIKASKSTKVTDEMFELANYLAISLEVRAGVEFNC